MAANGYRVSFCGDDNVLKFIVVMTTQIGEYTKNNRTVCFKCVNYISTKLLFLNALISSLFNKFLAFSKNLNDQIKEKEKEK